MNQQFRELCKDKNISPSITRESVYDYLDGNETHPTVDEIYKELKPKLPTLSKTTVYNILKLFTKEDIILEINTREHKKRYELNNEDHAHFTCDMCGQIYDLPKVEVNYNLGGFNGFHIKHEEVNLRGVCKDCRDK
ncbi:MAG: transcriptional repressor [Candidatus Izimaplasma sp.]|nr:transcriptional repressor [Candidatus Izimaplasma bacterium]